MDINWSFIVFVIGCVVYYSHRNIQNRKKWEAYYAAVVVTNPVPPNGNQLTDEDDDDEDEEEYDEEEFDELDDESVELEDSELVDCPACDSYDSNEVCHRCNDSGFVKLNSLTDLEKEKVILVTDHRKV